VYLDHASTTAIRPCAHDAMRPWLEGQLGNPSSMHESGRLARQAIEDARDTIAEKINCRPRDIIFTSGGTEANNLALRGVAGTWDKNKSMLISSMEHPSVLETAEFLESDTIKVKYIKPDSQGLITAAGVEELIEDSTALVAVMRANNEIGNLNDVAAIATLLREKKIHCHTDAVQALGHITLDFQELGVDSMSINGHKIGGPAGVGALVLRREVRLATLQRGGGQELGKRGGTENLVGILGMAAAINEAVNELETRQKKWAALKDSLLKALQRLPGVLINSNLKVSLPHILNVSFENLESESLIIRLDMEGVCLSSGSACHADHPEPSHVLKAIGRSQKQAAAALRFSFGPDTSLEECDLAVEKIEKIIPQLRRKTGKESQ
jgi:cysteine desulfurase